MNSIFLPTTSKKTEVIEGEVDQVVEKIVEILRSEIKVI
jgi:hypothetical protein